MNLCVIPARGGSKRIPRKNIRDFCGRPIIAWSIECALASGCFERIVVSTDDDEIAGVAREWGADVPFRRPAALSDDHTGTNAVVAHALEWFAEEGQCFEAAACIYATAPFLSPDVVRDGAKSLEASGAHFAVTVTSFPFPIQRAIRVNATGTVELVSPEHRHSRSQDLEETFHDAGQLYWGLAEAFRAGEPLFGTTTRALILPRSRVQDIDTLEDWERAELMFRALNGTEV